MDGLSKAGGIASALKSIFSVIAVVVVAITSCSYAYSKIFENERNIGLLKHDDAESFKLLRERSDKRHKRKDRKRTSHLIARAHVWWRTRRSLPSLKP